jgi:O-antigen/teichoic acid export membrane protein
MPEGEEKKILNTILRGAGITAFGLFFSKTMTYIYRALVGRALGPEAYGMLTTGMMIGGIAATFAGAPVKNGLKKFIPEFQEEGDIASIKGMVLSALQLNLIGSILVGTIIFYYAEFLAVEIFSNKGLIPILQVFGFLQIVARPEAILTSATVAFNKAKYKVISTNIFQPITQLVLTIIFIIAGMRVMGAVWGWVGAIALAVPLNLYFLEKKVGPVLTAKVKPKYSRKKLFNYSYPLFLSGMIGTFLGWADTAFIGYFMDQTAVGFYNAAYPTALILTIPVQAFGTLALTSFSELGAKGLSKDEALKTLTRWVFALTFPGFLIMTLYSSELLTLLFGSEYAKAGLALSIVAFGTMFSSALGKIGDILKSAGKTQIIFYNTTLNMVLNIGLNILLIPIYGIVGAAIATASSTVVMNIILALEAWKYENVQPLSRNMVKTIFAGLTSITATYIIFKQIFPITPLWAMIPAGITFLGIYTITFGKIGGLKEYDKEVIETAARKVGLEKETRKLLKIIT